MALSTGSKVVLNRVRQGLRRCVRRRRDRAFNQDRKRSFAVSAVCLTRDTWRIELDDGRTLIVTPDLEAAWLMSPYAFKRALVDYPVDMTAQ
jgi:hypothetical protein